jgi:hypothetical protein
MRRTAALAALGLTLLTAAACGDTKEPTTAPTAAAPTTAAASSANNEAACAAFEALFAQDRMQKFGVPVGQLIAARNAKNDAAAKEAEAKIKTELDGLVTDVQKISADASTDPAVKAQLDAAAAQITSAKDLKFLDGVTKTTDLQGPFTTLITGWIQPLAKTCGLT